MKGCTIPADNAVLSDRNGTVDGTKPDIVTIIYFE